MDILVILPVAIVVDLALGEPPRPIHPVVWMGKVASSLEKGGAGHSCLAQFVYGMGMSLFLIGLFAAPTYFILHYLKSLSFVAYVIIGAVFTTEVRRAHRRQLWRHQRGDPGIYPYLFRSYLKMVVLI